MNIRSTYTITSGDVDAIEDAMVDAAQFMDGVKPDAVKEGWWSDWDGETRRKITRGLLAILRTKRPRSARAYESGHMLPLLPTPEKKWDGMSRCCVCGKAHSPDTDCNR